MRRIEVIEHQVNEHAGDRDIEPKRQGPARDATVTQELAAFRAAHGDDHKGHDRGSQKSMRAKYREVDWARNSLTCEARHTMMRMIDDIGDQKEHGSTKRGDLASDVRLDVLAPNEEIARRQQQKRGSVKKRIEVREDGKEFGH